MRTLTTHLPLQTKPLHKAAVMPEPILSSEKDPKENPINPPKNVDRVLMYGPSITPISGAIIAAAVIA